MEVKINNEPAYARDYEFIVARNCDGEWWFWGAYADGYKAERAALEINGTVFHNLRMGDVR